MEKKLLAFLCGIDMLNSTEFSPIHLWCKCENKNKILGLPKQLLCFPDGIRMNTSMVYNSY